MKDTYTICMEVCLQTYMIKMFMKGKRFSILKSISKGHTEIIFNVSYLPFLVIVHTIKFFLDSSTK